MKFAGADPRPRVSGAEELPGKVNYFIGNDPAKWRAGVVTYAKVRYESVYPGVDVILLRQPAPVGIRLRACARRGLPEH